MPSEFSLIKQYFQHETKNTDLGIGDDGALLSITTDKQLVVSADMLVAGTHFFDTTAAYDIGWKSLAVNISDIAAMGATPKWATLSLALPEAKDEWLSNFSDGFFTCADTFGIDLIGGDTTRGALNISVQIMGEVTKNSALQRNAAKEGDDIWVSGRLGDAALALAILQKKYILDARHHNEFLVWKDALNKPQPRAALGLALIGIAHAAIDISDGLISDLGHILVASNFGATIHLAQLPISNYIAQRLQDAKIQRYALAGGDDYELCFTASNKHRSNIQALSEKLHLQLSNIGKITQQPGLKMIGIDNQPFTLNHKGFDHFG